MIYKDDTQVREACKEWQKRLRLQDWIVKAGIYRARDMDLNECQGECVWHTKTKLATIRLIDPVDYPEGLIEDQDMEKTLVHELLHLHFAPIHADTDNEMIDDA